MQKMKRIVIIGASSGIGKRVAIHFAKAGWRVAIAARREDKLKEVADMLPECRVVYSAIDVTADDAAVRFLSLVEANGGIDTLLFASGVGFANPALDPQRDSNMVNVNVKGFTQIVDAAFAYFREHPDGTRRQIAAITSVAGTKGLGVAAAYSASKRYQQAYLQALAQLAKMQRVDVAITDIRPGFICTDLLDPNKKYPLIMKADYAADLVAKAVEKKKRVAYVDWRWGVIVALWRLIPNCLWRRMKVALES